MMEDFVVSIKDGIQQFILLGLNFKGFHLGDGGGNGGG